MKLKLKKTLKKNYHALIEKKIDNLQESPHLARTGVLFQELKTARGDLL
jgi:hypothetical protein